eukprot:Amastigsp_a841213_423.p5 type:complete len:111 gc:universal Amastigsp_a841213_423:826-1158(+)
MAPRSCVTSLRSPRRNSPRSSSSMSWTPSEPSAQTRSSPAAARSSAPCSSSSTRWTASRRTPRSRSLLPPTASMSLILPCSARGGSTARSSFRTRTRLRESTSSRSTRAP